jgi:hypothetical protein
MSNIVPTNIQIPAHLARLVGQPSALSAALAGGLGGGAEYPRISIKGSRFRIVEGGTETVLEDTKLSVVVVGANPRLSKTYYAKQWTPDAEPASPDCYSLDGVRPAADSTGPQNDTCAGCPMNAWGSKITPMGQQIKACADQKRLAVVASNDPTGPVYLLQITPAALKGLASYQKELSVRGIPVEAVKTVVTFDTDASFPKLAFKFGGFLEADEYAAVEELFGSDKVMEITGEKVAAAPEEEAPAPKPKAAPKAAAKVAPPPEPEPEPEEAPAPKRGFGAKAAPAAAEKAEAPAPKPKAAAKPAAKPAAAAPKVEKGATSLADEIASLMEDMDADD